MTNSPLSDGNSFEKTDVLRKESRATDGLQCFVIERLLVNNLIVEDQVNWNTLTNI